MKHVHLLCDDGITAELWLGALIHAGADPDAMQTVVDQAGVAARIRARRVQARQVEAVQVEVDDADHAPQQRLATADALHDAIGRAPLGPRAMERATRLGTALLAAEATVHGVPVERVHLHELGRPRTVARILASAVALDHLAVGTITVGPVALGGGTIDIAHGRFPVPPPAALVLLQGFQIHGDERQVELTTPSGAAVLAALARPTTAIPPLQLEAHGRGSRPLPGGGHRLLTLLLGTDPPG